MQYGFTRAAVAALTLGLVLAASPAAAEQPVPTLEQMWEQMQQMARELAELRGTVSEQQAVINDQAAALEERELMGFSEEGRLPDSGAAQTIVGGYADIEFSNFDMADSDFDQHRTVLFVGRQLHERIQFYSEFEFEHGVDTGAGGGAVEVEQAWIDFELHPWLVFRGGALLVPFGRYNLYHDSDMNDLTARPLYARRIVPTTWTEAGMGFHGDVELPRDMALEYELYAVNGFDDGITDQGTRGARPALRRDNNNNKATVGRVALTPVPWMTIGASGYAGRWTSTNGLADPSRGFGDQHVTGYGLDLFARRGPVEVIAEYGGFDFENADLLGPVGPGVILDGDMHGGYVQAAYHFWPAILNGTSLGEPYDNPTFTLIGRAEMAEIGLMGASDNQQDRYILGLNYRPIEELVFKAEWHWNDHRGGGTPLENDGEDGFLGSVALSF